MTAVRSRWWSKRALLAHLALLIWVPGCAVAAWWQVTVALSGDHLAYVYSVEWPVFAVFGVIAWWNLVHDDPGRIGARALRQAAAPSGELDLEQRHVDEEDEELAAYNTYLAALAERGAPKTWRRR